MDEIIKDFKFATDIPRIIKVIGVGGGGCNAVSHMYRGAGNGHLVGWHRDHSL